MCINILLCILPTTRHRVSCFNPRLPQHTWHKILQSWPKGVQSPKRMILLQNSFLLDMPLSDWWFRMELALCLTFKKNVLKKTKIFGDTVDGRIHLPGEIVYHMCVYIYMLCMEIYIYIPPWHCLKTSQLAHKLVRPKTSMVLSTSILN